MVYYCPVRCITGFYMPSWSIRCWPVLASVGIMRMHWMDHCSVLKWQFCILLFKEGKSWVMFNEAEGKSSCPWKLFVQGHTFLLVVHLPPAWNSQWLVSGKAKWGPLVMFRQSGGKSHSRLNADHNKKAHLFRRGLSSFWQERHQKSDKTAE